MRIAPVLALIAAFALAGCNITAPPGPRAAASIADAGFRPEPVGDGNIAFACEAACGGSTYLLLASHNLQGTNAVTAEESIRSDPTLLKALAKWKGSQGQWTTTSVTFDAGRSLFTFHAHTNHAPRLHIVVLARVRGNEARFLGIGAETPERARRYARTNWLD